MEQEKFIDSDLKVNNIFKYATSELSQDAFICWLLSHATEEGWDADLQLRNCAIAFINHILSARNLVWHEDDRIVKIYRQYKNIDILVQLKNHYIIIEDKTFTNSHDDQVNRYKQALVDERIPKSDILCVYYKIEEQPKPEENVDYEFTREILLKIFRPYKNRIQNPIFGDYLEYLQWIDCQINSFRYLPITQWTRRSYIGFFSHLAKTYLKGKSNHWGYVANRAGGFMGLWWVDIFTSDELDRMGLDRSLAKNIYLQIEDDIIAVKYSIDSKMNPNPDKIREIRWKLYYFLHNHLGSEFEKRRFAFGRWMTVGYVRYNENNYIEQLTKMHDILCSMKHMTFI